MDGFNILFLNKVANQSNPSFISSGSYFTSSFFSCIKVQHIEAVNEINKTRNLLRVQTNINNEQKKEILILQKRLDISRLRIEDQLSEYQKILELRAAKIEKLENQLQETSFGTLEKSLNMLEDNDKLIQHIYI